MTHAYKYGVIIQGVMMDRVIAPTNLANLLGALSSLIMDKVSVASPAEHVSMSEHMATILIAKYPGCSIDELHGALELSHSGCVRLVNRLVQKGYVRREKGQDKRAVALHLTPDGEDAATHGFQRREDVLMQMLNVLDESEAQQLSHIVSKLLLHGSPAMEDIARTCRLCDERACTTCPFHPEDVHSSHV